MLFSKSCEYALRATLFLAKNEAGHKTRIHVIAKKLDMPEQFLGKIMQTLVKHRVVSSMKGRNGGFYLTKEEINAPLLRVVEAIDGPDAFSKCGLGLKSCSEKRPCPLHDDVMAYRDNLQRSLNSNSLHQFAMSVKTRDTFLYRK